MALKDIKAKIQATQRMNTVTRAMEAVSAVKMRKTQAAALEGRSYARAALSILARLSGSSELSNHPLAHTRTGTKLALIVMTSDRGLAGALNSGVLRKAFEIVSGEYESVTIYAIGRKADEFFRRRNFTIAKAYENKHDQIELSVMEDLSSEISNGFLSGEYDEVKAVYTNFKSTFEQVPSVRGLLPLTLESVSELVREIQPVRGKFSEGAAASTPSLESPVRYTIEPEAGPVLDVLLPRLVAISLYHMLLESKASEHSARMVAMKNASDKSKEVARDLTRVYNKVRQAAITREVSEIVSGREALSV
ncbi:MAG: synthase gamma chain [Parcubacteria group bacterium]|nr:synthase gamma chain [Parcubacteria group bacterium]